jgi:uncharacterized membrane protein
METTHPADAVQLLRHCVTRARALHAANLLDDAVSMYAQAVSVMESLPHSLTHSLLSTERCGVYREYADLLHSHTSALDALPFYCKANAVLRECVSEGVSEGASDGVEDNHASFPQGDTRTHTLTHHTCASVHERASKDDQDVITDTHALTHALTHVTTGDASCNSVPTEKKRSDATPPLTHSLTYSLTPPVLTEAACASLAASFACYLLYPLEVLRTRTQVITHTHSASNSTTDLTATLSSLLTHYFTTGIVLRVGYILLCSFLYSFIFESLKRRCVRVSEGVREFSWRASFFCSGAACVLTVVLTQALDSYIYRSQVTASDALRVDTCGWQEVYTSTAPLVLLSKVMRAVWCEGRVSLHTVLPSLLLCVNPALYFTLFDYIQSWWLHSVRVRSATASREAIGRVSVCSSRLSSSEAFVVGFLAKTVCTLLTYPLIRAKVLLAASSITHTTDLTGTTLLDVLMSRLVTALHVHIQEGGVTVLFRGLTLHILHASLRDACSMV